MLPSLFAIIVGTIIVISVTFVVIIIIIITTIIIIVIIIMNDTSWSLSFNQTPKSVIATCPIPLSNVYFFLGIYCQSRPGVLCGCSKAQNYRKDCKY